MDRTIIALFDNRADAERARQDLIRSGFSADDISMTDRPPQTTAAEQPSFWDRVKEFFGAEEENTFAEATRRGGTLLSVAASDQTSEKAADIINKYGPADVDERVQAWRHAGWQQERQTAPQGQGAQEQRIPVVEEQLKVGKRQSRRGVRIYSRVVEEPVEEQVRLRDERVTVERQRTTRPVEGEPFKEKVIEVTETHEEPVVSKEAHVTEDVVVRKESGEHTETVRDKVRRTDVRVEDLDRDFRKDYERSYAAQGGSYEQFRPAYEYGRDLARAPGNRDRDWKAVEPEARDAYERRQPGSWSRYGEAVHRGYEQTHAAAGS